MIKNLKQELEAGNTILGYNTTIKAIKKGIIKQVIMANNIEPEAKKDLTKLCRLAKIELISAQQNNDELGIMCKKPFSVSVIGIK